ncbi:NAD(P)-binding domain-containing protein [Shewanella livingstonensis]|uniref:SDR family NAD(P)-dependent oxidoreductase n=1 Tax=Shewanella livingstonensis TaxID=150120 RepID=A0A3G8LUF1_9GAMM|nr:NAD(P)-binding domain-containing protein [Shewanella livingstonensis]AZG72855.1 SDR family NAD(P)-dependent oxidoreductase [Shewanella livingstonensis]
MHTITIIGCGWFGFPLATQLIKQGFKVKASKRHVDDLVSLQQAGIKAYQLDLANVTAEVKNSSLFDADAIVINLPPGLRRGEADYIMHLTQLKNLMGEREYQKVIFISTTGVYPSLDQTVSEQDADTFNDTSGILLQAEAMFAAMQNSCIVRFSGLVGPKRHPGRFFAGKVDVSGANVAVNLVHLHDCIAAVSLILSRTDTLPIYNLAANEHPTRGEFYVAATEHLGLIAPQFNQQQHPSKIINGQLISHQLGFQYTFSNPFKMLDAC